MKEARCHSSISMYMVQSDSAPMAAIASNNRLQFPAFRVDWLDPSWTISKIPVLLSVVNDFGNFDAHCCCPIISGVCIALMYRCVAITPCV